MRRALAVVATLALGACSALRTPQVSPERLPGSPSVSAETPSSRPASAPAVPWTRATVTRVVDGDTAHMRLADGTTQKVRFIGVDTPESTIRHEPFGREASAFTKRALDGATVFLEFDVGGRDRYGRLLAYVWLRPPTDGSDADVRANMFNAILVAQGYANILTIPPNVRYAGVFLELERQARRARRGLWSA